MTTVTYCLTSFYGLHAQYRRLQRAHITQLCANKRKTVQTDTQPAHIKLILPKSLYSRTIQNMLQYRYTVIPGYRYSGNKLLRTTVEICYLLLREVIKLRLVAAGQMREHTRHSYSLGRTQSLNKPRHVLFIEAQSVHAAVYLDMYRHVLQPLGFGGCNNRLQRLMRIHIRLQVILEYQVHRSHFRVHDDNRQRDSRTSEFHTFVRYSYRQIIH